jgi:hypothetical protein
VLTNDDGSNPRLTQPVVTTNSTATAPIMITATTEEAVPANTQADSVMMEAPTEPGTDAESAAAAGAAGPEEDAPSEAAPKETTEVESAAQQNTEVSALQAADSSAADESREDEPGQTSISIEQPAAPIPTASSEPSPTLEPTATSQPTPTPTPSESSGTSEGHVSNWRIAEIALGLLLAWLIVTLIGLRRLRQD